MLEDYLILFFLRVLWITNKPKSFKLYIEYVAVKPLDDPEPKRKLLKKITSNIF